MGQSPIRSRIALAALMSSSRSSNRVHNPLDRNSACRSLESNIPLPSQLQTDLLPRDETIFLVESQGVDALLGPISLRMRPVVGRRQRPEALPPQPEEVPALVGMDMAGRDEPIRAASPGLPVLIGRHDAGKLFRLGSVAVVPPEDVLAPFQKQIRVVVVQDLEARVITVPSADCPGEPDSLVGIVITSQEACLNSLMLRKHQVDGPDEEFQDEVVDLPSAAIAVERMSGRRGAVLVVLR